MEPWQAYALFGRKSNGAPVDGLTDENWADLKESLLKGEGTVVDTVDRYTLNIGKITKLIELQEDGTYIVTKRGYQIATTGEHDD